MGDQPTVIWLEGGRVKRVLGEDRPDPTPPYHVGHYANLGSQGHVHWQKAGGGRRRRTGKKSA